MLKNIFAATNNYLVKQLPKATVFVNERLEVVYVSDRFITEFNLENISVLGQPVYKLLTQRNHSWENTLRDSYTLTTKDNTSQLEIHTEEGLKWYESTCTRWFDENENALGLIIDLEDITENTQITAERNKLKSLLDSTCEVAKIGCWEFCAKEQVMTWCAMTRSIYGVTDDFVPTVDNSISFYKDGHSRNTISMILHNAAKQGTTWSEKLQIITTEGKEKWVLSAGKPIFDSGQLLGYTGTFQDIDAQVRSELKTKNSETLLRTLVDNLPLNVYIKDTESKKILVNKFECNYLGYSDPKEVLGKTDFDLYDEDIAQSSRAEDIKVFETGMPMLAQESVIRNKNGELTSFLCSKIPILGNDGVATGLLGISVDISEIKQKEEELRKLVSVTSQQNKKIVNFAHIVSHNLRSHSANFSMLLDFLLNEKNESEKKNILKMLTEASTDLSQTLEHLNEVIIINTQVNLVKESVFLKSKIDQIQRQTSGLLNRNGGIIINEVSISTCLKVIPSYLDNILTSVLTNAVKYRKPDQPPVIHFNATSENGFTVLSITDNGLGIDLKKYGDKVFGMYKTFHDNYDAKGMGLYIVRNQIEAMNGRITVDSRVGKGSTFKIYFNEKDQ